MKKHERQKSRGSLTPGSLHFYRTQKEKALSELRDLEVRQKRATLLDRDAVAAEWGAVLRQVRAGVLAITSRVRVRLPHLTAHDAEVVDEEIRRALVALADDGVSS